MERLERRRRLASSGVVLGVVQNGQGVVGAVVEEEGLGLPPQRPVVGVLLALILTRLLILLLGKAASGDVLPEAVLGLIAFGILTYLPVLLGIAVFVAVLLALSRSYRDSEMTVWFTSGLSIAAWIKPVLQFALPVAIICAVL